MSSEIKVGPPEKEQSLGIGLHALDLFWERVSRHLPPPPPPHIAVVWKSEVVLQTALGSIYVSLWSQPIMHYTHMWIHDMETATKRQSPHVLRVFTATTMMQFEGGREYKYI